MRIMLKKWLVPTMCLCGFLMTSCSKSDDNPTDLPEIPKTSITQVKQYIETVTENYSKNFQSELELANNLQFYLEMANGMSKAFESAENELLNNMFVALRSLIRDRDVTQLVYLQRTFPFDCKIMLDERTDPPTGTAYSVKFIQSEDTVAGLVMDRLGHKRVILDYYRADSILIETNIVMQFDPDAGNVSGSLTEIEKMEKICPKSVSIVMTMYDKSNYFIGDVFNAIIYPSVDAKALSFKATSRIDFPNGRSLSFTDIVTNFSKNTSISLDIFGNSVLRFDYMEFGQNQFDCQFGFKKADAHIINVSTVTASLGQELSFEFNNISDAKALDIMLPVLLSVFSDNEITVQELKLLLKMEDPIAYAKGIKTNIYAYRISYGFGPAAEISLVERPNGKIGLDLVAQDGTSCPITQVKFFGKNFSELFNYLMDTVKKLAEMGIMIQQSGFSSKIFDIFLK